MKVLIVENDPLIVEDLQDKLMNLGYATTRSADNVKDAISIVNKEKPSVVLVDIELNGKLDGIDLGKVLNTKKIPFIYLSRLQDQHTFDRAKATHPQSNIPKPVSLLQLRNSLLEVNFKEKEDEKDYLSISRNGKKTVLNKAEIKWLKADRNYCLIYIGDTRYQSSTPMNNVLSRLNADKFVKVHRSHAINIDYVDRYEGNMIYLKGIEEPISLSETYRTNFLKRFDAV